MNTHFGHIINRLQNLQTLWSIYVVYLSLIYYLFYVFRGLWFMEGKLIMALKKFSNLSTSAKNVLRILNIDTTPDKNKI
uniref:Uncharacterized protein n=1 Tax=Glossina brevipalpis TaxID=37001 RepID=A0A1A9WUZ7_9MUSC